MAKMVPTYLDGVQRGERPMTAREELLSDTDAWWHKLSHQAFPAGMPANIDEYRERLDVWAALSQTLLDDGMTQAEIDALPEAVKKALAVFMKVVILAVWKTQGGIPGAKDMD